MVRPAAAVRTRFAVRDPGAPDGVHCPGSVGKAVGCAAFVLFAVLLEIFSGQAANSDNRSWLYGLVPLTWPDPARVVWWLFVAAAAWGHRIYLVRAGLGSGRWLGALLAAPFSVFAAGIAVGASRSTWH
jgi:hypothetical protein